MLSVKSLLAGQRLEPADLAELLTTTDEALRNALFATAQQLTKKQFTGKIYIRGLIEFTNFCANDCYYCGIRCSNNLAQRYRLTQAEILECCDQGYALGFRTFVLQGGEDGYFTDALLVEILTTIKAKYPDCAITLSIGERSYTSYKALFDAGADRYLLRHETATDLHYSRLHPIRLTLAQRKECLYMLKDIGYQVGTGFMVGSPYQTTANLVADLLFIQEFKPHMVGIGPFIPHHETPFRHQKAGTLEQTLRCIALLRLLLPHALIPATTALATIHPSGRELGILAGANVVMPNLSPLQHRAEYSLYDNKACTGDEAAEAIASLQTKFQKIGYNIVVDRGDYA
ncbi:MAG: [FeFe] hydrogenase H-cluster radical SAM maturase HydE [Acidaminococcaceae bacterium]